MNKKFILFTQIFILSSFHTFAQYKTNGITQTSNSVLIKMEFVASGSIQMNEAKPGSPALSSKVVYVAVPPKSSVTAALSNKKVNTTPSADFQINPSISLSKDSVVKYKSENLYPEYFQGDTYPLNDLEILGYTWIRDYYCAVIKINLETYNWKKKELTQIESADLKVNFTNPSSFIPDNSQPSIFEKNLSSVIINYEQAGEFRAKRNIFSDTTGNWINYSNEYVKLGIVHDGVYHITFDNLLQYGITPAAINPKTFKTFLKEKKFPFLFSAKMISPSIKRII